MLQTQVKNIIAENKKTKDPILNLGRCGLTEWPKKLFELTHLKTLIMSNRLWDDKTSTWIYQREEGPFNKLNSIPEDIKELKNLERLEIGGSGYIYDTASEVYKNELGYLPSSWLNVYIDEWGIKDEDLKVLPLLRFMTHLNISYTETSDLTDLRSLWRLRSLNLSSTNVKELHSLENLRQLQMLNLSFTKVSDLSVLEDSPQLHSLNLRSTKIDQFPNIKKLEYLDFLDISSTTIRDITALKNCKRLKTLNLSSTKVKDLTVLESLTLLESLDISSTKVNDISFLKDWWQKNLRTLNISDTQIASIDEIRHLKWLDSLDLSSTNITSISSLQSCSRLTKLNLSDTRINDFSVFKHLSQLQILDLSYTEINSAEILSYLEQIQILNLSNTKITNISRLEYLKNIVSLDLRSTEISDISPLSGLDKIEKLDLSETQITDIEDIKDLNLNVLILYSTKIEDLTALSNLPALQMLDLSFCQEITDFSDIENLRALTVLNLSHTNFENTSLLRKLIRLHTISLSHTQIDDIKIFQYLTVLQTIDIRHTNTSDLRPLQPLIKKGISLRWEGQGDILVYNCPLKYPSPEIIQQGHKAVLNYFREFNTAEKTKSLEKLYEAKLLILGESEAGKTSLFRKLQDSMSKLPSSDESTEGIDIHQYNFIGSESQPFKINLWDFGGQEIYHSTHQFFLTKRSLYVLVTDGRKENTDFDYWLRIIELLAGDSPTIIVQNVKHGRQQEIDFGGLCKQYQYVITPLFNLDLKYDDKGLERLRKEIEHQIQQLPHIGNEYPRVWKIIRERLEERGQIEPHINLYEYYKVCREAGMYERERARYLSQYLHDLGVFLHFQEHNVLNKTIILQNEWATEGVYAVLDHEEIKKQYGHFTEEQAKRIWKTDRFVDMHSELLALMSKFELCYHIPDTKEPKEYISPQLLSKQRPDYTWIDKENLELRYKYEFMPKGIIGRFIVRKHKYIREVTREAWRSGVILHRQDSKAEIVETYGKSTIRVRVQGRSPKILMTLVTDELDSIHETYTNIQVTKYVPCICSQCKRNIENAKEPHFYPHNNLLYRQDRDKKEIECAISFEMVSVESLLNAVFTSETPNPEEDQTETLHINSITQEEYINRLIAQNRYKSALEIMQSMAKGTPEESTARHLIAQTNQFSKDLAKNKIGYQDRILAQNNLLEGIQHFYGILKGLYTEVLQRQIVVKEQADGNIPDTLVHQFMPLGLPYTNTYPYANGPVPNIVINNHNIKNLNILQENKGNIQINQANTPQDHFKHFKELVELVYKEENIEEEDFEEFCEILDEIEEVEKPNAKQKRRWKRWLGKVLKISKDFVADRFNKGLDTVISEKLKAWIQDGGLNKIQELCESMYS